jgi:dTDP-glucose pyrophosphorylase
MMAIDNFLVEPTATIRQTIEVIDKNSTQIALVVDENRRLLGTVTDGDIRRGILRGVELHQPVQEIMNSDPSVVRNGESREFILALMKQKRLRHIPVVDEAGCIMRLELMDEIIQAPRHDNWVVLMAGGLGTRLAPLTNNCPKPLLKVGNKPVLQTILENFIEHGFHRFYLSVNYKAEMIEEYFGDGSRWGVEIRYVHETKRMGTAGALSLLPEKVEKPIIVMNGDLLTKINFQQLLQFHTENRVQATMCVREYDFQVPYGVVMTDQHSFLGIEEKPIHRFFVNAGVYVLDPSALDLIPPDTFFDMPSLFSKVKEMNQDAIVFPIREYWLDIGRMDDFERANEEYQEVFS